MSQSLTLEVWSDIACPWCYIGKRRFERALAAFPHRAGVRVSWRSFQLDPSTPRVGEPGKQAERLAKKYGTSPAQAEAMIARVVSAAEGEGITMDFTRLRSENTFDGHRMLQLAKARGVQDALKERLMRAYFCEGAALGDVHKLAALGGEAGLDADECSAVLAADDYTADVRADIDEARRLGISGVPFFLFGGRYAVSGAQPQELFLQALTQSWDELAGSAPVEGEVCTPDGCA